MPGEFFSSLASQSGLWPPRAGQRGLVEVIERHNSSKDNQK